ncbi:chromosome segregation protein SMC [Aerococcus urinae]|uniref:chromosome segregation protein SMC n=1 Tax=Aerococcus urinae TaxID=1376 RepID=UPI00227BD6F1|nr:chromosome segregation protein SMC [Aerococcus urinae]MCY3051836.1 chromosome segregation protein SMC [Aerococcus urinae]
MYLKTIEMVGFKSFAEKTRVELDRGFTAIVGPNGSGKSNITEAVKWVLGEQSAKSLRGKRMDDVIFSGSQSRRQSQYAQVVLTFDNSDRVLDMDSDEVSVLRRYTRSGDSIYKINGQNCRLKDITQLMMDTGVGKESFSIISQGKVEEIFTQRAEERRAIFEEAAGVMKYKSKKQEAERKLDRSQENLNRIEDILSEIEGRLDPLKEQKEAAVSYRDKKQELSQIEIALTAVQIETLNEQWQLAKKDLESIQASNETKKRQLDQEETALSQAKVAEEQSDDRVNDLNDNYVVKLQAGEKLRSQLQMMEQEQRFIQSNRQSQEKEQANLQAKIEKLKANLKSNQAQLDKYQETYQSQADSYQSLKDQLAALSDYSEEDLEDLRNQYIAYLQEESHLSNQIQQNEKDIQQGQKNQEKYAERIRSTKKEQAKLEDQQEELDQEISHKEQRLKDLLQEYQTQVQSLQQAQAQVQKATNANQTLNQKLLRKQAQLDSLKNLEDNHEGFYYGVKNALKLKSQKRGIFGAIAELIDVPEDYTLAVETALGGSMQNIVTQNGQVAQEVITYLKAKKAGRATFLPLDTMKSRRISDQQVSRVQADPAYIGLLVDLVDFDDQFQTVMENVMGNIILAEDLTGARRLSQALHARYRIVTLTGDLVNAGGSLTGGANKRTQTSLLSRKNDIQSLSQAIESMEAAYQEAASRIATQEKDQDQMAQALESLKEKGSEARYDLRSSQTERERLTQELEKLAKEVQGQDYEKNLSQEDVEQSQADLATSQKKLTHLQGKIQAAKAKIDARLLSDEEKGQQKAHLQDEFQQIATDFAVTKEQVKQAKDRKNSLSAELADQEKSYQELANLLSQALTNDSDQEEKKKHLEAQLQSFQKQSKDIQSQLKTAKEERQKASQKVEAANQMISQLNSEIQSNLQSIAKLEASASRYEVSIDNHLEQLSESYGLTYERARAESQLTMSIDQASSRVKQLKQAIDSLGPVNMQAIEEYDEVYERFCFIDKQRQDAIDARENLYQTIAEMDSEVSSRFKTTFEAIRDAFESIFPALFGGGKATLKLTDPNDLLNTGVEIMAQPPGKKLQLLSLLSGGERALTAIALLFAILDVKTVPFSILDEVEAALDDANVARYGRYLQKFAQKTQFIVISHRKGTMEAANILYGVTMQQEGISQLASVRLEDVDDQLN